MNSPGHQSHEQAIHGGRRRRDADGMAAVHTESAWTFPPNAAARKGREAIRELKVATTVGGQTAFDEALIESFRAGLRGDLLLQSHSAYDEARKIHNGMTDRRLVELKQKYDPTNFFQLNQNIRPPP